MTPKRIALLHYTASPVVGGVESVIARHAVLMTDSGHQVTIVAGRGGSVDPRVPFVRLRLADTRRPRMTQLRAELDRGTIPEGFAALADEATADLAAATTGVDVLIAHNVASLPMNLALTAALHRLSQQPGSPAIVLWHHDVAAEMTAYRDQLHPGWPWDLVRSAWPRTTSVAISAARAAAYARTTGLAPADIRVIPDGIDLAETLGLHPTTARLISERRIDVAAPILLVPARLTARKNLELAVEIVAALSTTMDGACLVVTGALDPHDRTARAYLARLHGLAGELAVADRFHVASDWLTGPPTRRIVTDLLRVADALLLTSRDEGFGLPVLEAAAHRLPVFCADIDALREIAGANVSLFALDATPAAIAALISDRLSGDVTYQAAVRTRRAFAWRAIYRASIEPLLASLAGTS